MSAVLAGVAAGALSVLLWRRVKAKQTHDVVLGKNLFSPVLGMFGDVRLAADPPSPYPRLDGRWNGLPVQLRPVVDTLSARKLPVLWLQVTLAAPLDTGGASFDFMMRPAGLASFSNFDSLFRLDTPLPGWPADGEMRSDRPDMAPPLAALTAARPLLDHPRAKELLVTPRGVRLVLMLAEADKIRYGAFRQASFEGLALEPAALAEMLERLAQVMGRLAPTGSVAA